jgi:uncharacterized protein (DUF302 family)
MAADGLTTIPSAYGAKETADRLEAEIRAKGMAVFARIDHAAGAAQAGLALQPPELLIFGNAKALVWQDASGKVWLSYNEPSWIARRHEMTAATKATVDAMAHGVSDLARKATK